MITRIEVKGYRSLRYCCIDIQEFQMFVGPNGTGKSTFFDVLAFVRDVLISGLDKAIFGDVRLNILVRASDPKDITWLRKGGLIEIAVTAKIPKHIQTRTSPFDYIRYELAVNTDDLTFFCENVWLMTSDGLQSGSSCPEITKFLWPTA
jgi:predicted ATP-dependent endonuclease of OLD family